MDPYYLSQKEVNMSMTELRSMLDNREDMLNDPRGGNIEIFKSIGGKMTSSIQTLRGLLNDITATIAQVRANPNSFKISETEMSHRESFVKRVHEEIADIEAQMNIQSSNQRSLCHVSPFQPVSPVSTPAHEIPYGQSQQLMAHQEEVVDQIAETVRMQSQIGKEIINAMNEEKDLILELGENIDTANDAMKEVTKRITALIENEGRTATYTVAVLSIVLIIMLFWVA